MQVLGETLDVQVAPASGELRMWVFNGTHEFRYWFESKNPRLIVTLEQNTKSTIVSGSSTTTLINRH